MLEYLPWSERQLLECIEDYKKGVFSILDLELGGGCNFNCVYCDSPDRKKECIVDKKKIEMVIQQGGIKWIYICGLGEPMYGKNLEMLYWLLECAEKYGVKCSLFTNLSGLNEKILEYIDKKILYLLFKMDTLKPQKVEKLYSTKEPGKQLQNIDTVVKHAVLENGCTNLAASIVPTRENADEIADIVDWCISNNIFPLVAELENAGNGEESFEQLSLNQQELIKIKQQILKKSHEETKVPICPAMISGIHINYKNEITVDRTTGFSCHWFWLQNPEVNKIASFNGTCSWSEYGEKIKNYRKSKTDEIKKCLEMQQPQDTVFGGCGGSVEELLKEHLLLHN